MLDRLKEERHLRNFGSISLHISSAIELWLGGDWDSRITVPHTIKVGFWLINDALFALKDVKNPSEGHISLADFSKGLDSLALFEKVANENREVLGLKGFTDPLEELEELLQRILSTFALVIAGAHKNTISEKHMKLAKQFFDCTSDYAIKELAVPVCGTPLIT